MRQAGLPLAFVSLALLAIVTTQAPTSKPALPGPVSSSDATRGPIVATYAQLPLSFEANQGQTDDSVKFLARGAGYTLFLTATEAVFRLQSRQAEAGPERSQEEGRRFRTPWDRRSPAMPPSAALRQRFGITAMQQAPEHAPERPDSVLRAKLVNASPEPDMQGLQQLTGKSHYFLGNDPSRWRTNIPNFAKVRYRNVYPGIDLVYYGNQGNLEYDFVVAPGADPGAIRMEFRGAQRIERDTAGNLILALEGSSLQLRRPLIYQEANGRREPISGGYVLLAQNQIGFEVGAFDANQPLVIDPVLTYSTYLGGSGEDIGYAITVDSSGSVYVAGEAGSTNFPKATPFQANLSGDRDAFVLKLNSAGSALVYSTYLGGSRNDTALGIAVHSSGTAYVAGVTDSPNFPAVGAIQAGYGGGPSDAFVTRLNANGSALVFSTYLGDFSEFGWGDVANGVALDSSGNAYVTGYTDASDFPTTPGAYHRVLGGVDAFVTKLNPTGSTLVYSTYLGGEDGVEIGSGIVVDASGNAYVGGSNIGGDLPVLNPYQSNPGGGTCGSIPCPDAFVSKLNPNGTALVYSTYLGGNGDDEGFAIAVDSSGSAHLTGYTTSSNFPVSNAWQPVRASAVDAFVTKLSPAGSQLAYSTHLGGNSVDAGFGIAVGSTGNAYITGQTVSNTFPVQNPIQPARAGSFDAFVTVLSPTGSSPILSTFLGGLEWENGRGIAVDSSGNVYVTGETGSSNFPTVGPIQSAVGGGICGTLPNTFPCDDVFVVKIADIASGPVPTLSSLSPSSAPVGGAAFVLTVNGTNFTTSAVVRWNGSSRTTTFVSASQLTASISASDIAAPGTAQVTVSAPGSLSNALPFTITSGGPVPTFTAASLVSAASFNLTGSAPAAASIAALFGSNLASSTGEAISLPLPLTLGGATLRLNNIAAPLFVASPGQINFQIPWELLGQTQASLTVTVGAVTSVPVNVNLAALAPGIFTTNAQGTGQGAILIAATGEVVAPVGSIPGRASRPAARGVDFITIYCTGLGDVTNRPASGAAAGSNPLSSTTTAPSVTIGGVPATVSFSGLVPGLVGLYQINLQVPANAPIGDAVPMIIVVGGSNSNSVSIAVQ